MHLIPTPRGTGIVGVPVPKTLLQMQVLKIDVPRLVFQLELLETFAALAKTYPHLTPDLWKDMPLEKAPHSEFLDYLANNRRPLPLAGHADA